MFLKDIEKDTTLPNILKLMLLDIRNMNRRQQPFEYDHFLSLLEAEISEIN